MRYWRVTVEVTAPFCDAEVGTTRAKRARKKLVIDARIWDIIGRIMHKYKQAEALYHKRIKKLKIIQDAIIAVQLGVWTRI